MKKAELSPTVTMACLGFHRREQEHGHGGSTQDLYGEHISEPWLKCDIGCNKMR